MIEFTYARAADVPSALELHGKAERAKYLGGGTNLVDLMRETIETPEALIDVTGLSTGIEERSDGTLRIGAGAKNTAVAEYRAVRERFPVLAKAIVSGASGQIRNMATVGGNIMQRTRCLYFYDDAARCNKRLRGSGCDALLGFNRTGAVLGASEACVATHPSDMCVALTALDATIHLVGTRGERSVKFVDFHTLPGQTPDVETVLERGELIVAVDIPPLAFARRGQYRKVRDRASYAFALVSLAAMIDVDGDGTIVDARLALGGVAHKPWRAFAAEAALKSRRADEATFREAAAVELSAAEPGLTNGFKIELARRVIAATLAQLADPSGARA